MNSGSLNPMERAIVEHIGRYRLTFQEIVGQLFLDGVEPQKTLNRLRDAQIIEPQKGFGGNRSAYVLTTAGAAIAGVSRRRADSLGSEALPVNLAILSFCLLKHRSRIRLHDNELSDVLGNERPSGRYHCLERGRNATCLYHIYAPGETTRPAEVVARTRGHMVETLKVGALQPWVALGLYVHAVLVDTPTREAELNALFDEALSEDNRLLRDLGTIHVECVPGSANLEEGLNGLA